MEQQYLIVEIATGAPQCNLFIWWSQCFWST